MDIGCEFYKIFEKYKLRIQLMNNKFQVVKIKYPSLSTLKWNINDPKDKKDHRSGQKRETAMKLTSFSRAKQKISEDSGIVSSKYWDKINYKAN